MNEVRVEQLGGFAGFGGPHLKSSGVVDLSRLSPADRTTVESLFQRYKASPAAPSYPAQFRYRLTRQTAAGTETVAYVEPVAVGDVLPDMPVFLTPDHYVPCPLEATYQTAWEQFPTPLKGPLESPPTP